ncbi:SIP domain-containing protein [Nonomuraea terrae]|nr:SIP domain-containing protein [Nonomuraea terrae]
MTGEVVVERGAGEALTCRVIRDRLVRDRNWPRTAITIKPFWTPGKRGLH